MGISYNPGVVTSGLIFAYDMANSSKSWKGAPVTNQFLIPTPDVNGFVNFAAQGTTGFQRLYSGNFGGYDIQPTDVVYKYVLGATGCHYHGQTQSVPAGTVVTFSFDFYIDPASTGYPQTNYLANFEGVISNAVVDPTPSIKGVWKRITMTSTASSTGNANFLLYPGACGDRLALSGFILYKNPQVEYNAPGNVPTPFVAGTRSNTQAVVDQTGQNVITANSLTYNADGTFSFNGAGNFISLPATVGYVNAVSAFAWIKTAGAPRGGYHIVFGPTSLEISIPASGEIRTGVDTANGRFVSNHGSGLTNGAWHYVGFTFYGTTKTSYIDGVNVGTLPVTGQLINSVGGRSMGIFGQGDSTYGMNGSIALSQIYNRALSDTEVLQNFNAIRGRYGI